LIERLTDGEDEQWRVAAGAAASLAWRNRRRSVSERYQCEERSARLRRM